MQWSFGWSRDEIVLNITQEVYLNVGQKTVAEEPKKPREEVFDKKELKKWPPDVATYIRGTAKKVQEKQVPHDKA